MNWVKYFFYIYWDHHCFFFFNLLLLRIALIFEGWTLTLMIYYPCNVLLYMIYCFEDFCYYVEKYWSIVVFSCDILISRQWWPYKVSWEVFLSLPFSEKFAYDPYYSSLKRLRKNHQWSPLCLEILCQRLLITNSFF